jgi:hypothetical protein
MRVRVNAHYFFYPVPMDRFDPCYGLSRGLVKEGDRVKVINMHGAPKANTMGHCYIQNEKGEFCGLVVTNSLTREKRGA